MSTDTNEVRLTGTIERIRRIETKTGAAMCEIILKVRQDRFRVTAHGNVAEHLLAACGPSDRLTVTGTLSVSSWKDETTGEWKNSFAVTAWGCEVHGDKVSYQRNQAARTASDRKPVYRSRHDEVMVAGPGDPF